jgi:predicted nucleic acid-binding protein
VKYALDTNIYIDAFRDPAVEAALLRFLERALPFTFLSAVVMQELVAGARTQAQVLKTAQGPSRLDASPSVLAVRVTSRSPRGDTSSRCGSPKRAWDSSATPGCSVLWRA